VACPGKILEKVLENYNSDKIFKELIDEMVVFIRENPALKSLITYPAVKEGLVLFHNINSSYIK
jgi:hypothetical protein